jgi:hypothetical protein
MVRLKKFFFEHFELSLIILIFLGILAIAFLVTYKLSFLNFFFLPVILSGYFLGKRQAVLTGIFCVLLVILYLIFFNLVFSQKQGISLDQMITVLTWGGFLILTGAVIGLVSEQRESQIKGLRRAYVGVLEIMLKYLEMADEERPRSLRVTMLAGKIAREAGLNTREIENIKSAALLYEAGDLRDNLPLFNEVISFMKKGVKVPEDDLSDKEQVMLKTTASLLKEIEPLLFGYFLHYVEESDVVDKDLNEVPLGSSIIALADMHERVSSGQPVQKDGEIRTFADIEKLAGRTFPSSIVQALGRIIIST